MIRLELPHHLRELAGLTEKTTEIRGAATLTEVMDRLEADHPELRGTLRDPVSGVTRPLVRFFALGSDITHQPLEARLPDEVLTGRDTLIVIGAIAGG